jgi:hypothetical protein
LIKIIEQKKVPLIIQKTFVKLKDFYSNVFLAEMSDNSILISVKQEEDFFTEPDLFAYQNSSNILQWDSNLTVLARFEVFGSQTTSKFYGNRK